MAAVQLAAVQPDSHLPTELREKFGGGATDAIREILERYGALVVAWPSLVAAAKRLRARGERLGERLVECRPEQGDRA